MLFSQPKAAASPPPVHSGYRPDIDGLRAIAVLAVVIFHAFPEWLPGGFVGVDIFFVISGFLISGILLDSLQDGRFSIADFYARRIRRIFPALLLVMLACFVAGWFILLPEEYRELGKHMLGGAGFVSNIVLWSEAGYFDASADSKPLLHLWSLGVEEQFYLFWPLLLWAAWRRRHGVLIALLLVLVASFAWNIASVHGDAVAAFYLPMSRFWELGAGALLAYRSRRRPALGPDRADLASAGGLLLMAIGIALITKEDAFPGWWAILPVAGAALMLAAGPRARLNRVLLSHRTMVWVGIISYPLYLWHWPLLTFARLATGATPSAKVRLAVVALSALLAWLTYRLLERPIRLRHRNRWLTGVLALLMMLTGALGYYVVKRNGMEFRNLGQVALFNDQVREVAVMNRFELPHPSCEAIAGAPHARDWCSPSVEASRPPELLLIGDSFSGAYAPMLARLYDAGREPSLVFRQFARGACPSLLGYGSDYCRDISARIAEFADRTPSIKTVVIAANWPGYFLPSEIDPTEALEQTIVHYRQRGKRVVVLLSPPNGASPKSCVLRAVRLSEADFCNLPRAKADAMDHRYRDRLLPILARHDVSVFDPYPYLCDAQGCKVIDGPRILYFDPGHLSEYGGQFLADHASAELRKLLAPQIGGEQKRPVRAAIPAQASR
ncbi:acyltransferase family protein [Herbaspirillum sp. WKF16]|uniref:acyltransferase family protein n=1 Tax=Herbaspirillum sp. WKF16 TaxID=3028312 RepID=UPI0023A9AA21|nr:acyltransferase family protein [Herbaspirillum sp. WKF16]WDZ96638.1 acyltransferase family protein [Herbaspirillum sp. WKF16]